MLYFSKWKIGLILAICLAGIVWALPNLLVPMGKTDLPDWWQPVNLGLDLQGGSHLLLEVNVGAVIKEQMNGLVETVRGTLRDARIRYRDLGADGASVVVRIPADPGPVDRDKVRALLEALDDAVTVSTPDDSGLLRLTYSEQALTTRKQAAVRQSIEIIRRRIDETGTREPTIQRQGDDRIIVELPGIRDPERVKRLIGKTAKLNFHLVDAAVSSQDAMLGRIPPSDRLIPATNGGALPYVVRRKVDVSGERLTDASATFQNNNPVVSFRFDTVGGRRFGDVTSKNVGKQLAIVLDDQVISAPVIRDAILGGSGVISGNFTLQEAQDLALLLRAGALPAPLTILEERTVGPGLGQDSINAGALASAVGVVVVVVFMFAAYGLFGLFANVALILNLLLLLGGLSLLSATLTLPGIAGIVLTMGMAVDANVLIYERMREEAKGGRSAMNAAEAGFGQAFRTIFDSNITTLAAAALLFFFGSGPVRGFAVTLTLGIVTSMFTAIMVTRLLVAQWIRSKRPKALPI